MAGAGSDRAVWYVIQSYSGWENKVAESINAVAEARHLQDVILEIAIPTENVETIESAAKRDENGKLVKDEFGKTIFEQVKKTRNQKKYPGYVFLKIVQVYDNGAKKYKISDEVWQAIRRTRGVMRFLGENEKDPKPLTDAEVQSLLYPAEAAQDAQPKQEEAAAEEPAPAAKPVVKLDYDVGDIVEIIDGIYAGTRASVTAIDFDKGEVTVSFKFMGTMTSKEYDFADVRIPEELK